MLRITRDGEKIIDKKMKFKEDLLSRRKIFRVSREKQPHQKY